MTSEVLSTETKFTTEHRAWLVVKRGLYYMPNDCGYTGIRDHAGRFTEAEAKARECIESGVSVVRLTDAPEYSPRCFDDLALAHTRQKLAEVVAALEECAREIGEWSRPKSANGMTMPRPDHPLMFAARRANEVLLKARGGSSNEGE